MGEAAEGYLKVLSKAMDLNLRYYRELTRVSVDYLRDLTTVVREVGGPSAAVPADTQPEGSLVFAGAAGDLVSAVFVVTNGFASAVEATIEASPFAGRDGRRIHPKLEFSRANVKLEPGEKIVVQARMAIPDDVDPGSEWRGEISVAGLPGTRIPSLLRRTG